MFECTGKLFERVILKLTDRQTDLGLNPHTASSNLEGFGDVDFSCICFLICNMGIKRTTSVIFLCVLNGIMKVKHLVCRYWPYNNGLIKVAH